MRYCLGILFMSVVAGCSSSYQYWQEDESTVAKIKEGQITASHTVQEGESLYVIAWLYHLDYLDIARWNNIQSPYIIYPDQKLQLVQPEGTSQSEQPVVRQSVVEKPDVQAALPRTNTASSWQWPTAGPPICRFGQGICKKGIYIKGAFRQDVFAAHTGTVMYSGTGVKDYGGLIIMQHEAGYFSAYAHNDRLLVKEKERVIAGQKIAMMGITRKNYPALYFEIRLNGKLLNPLKLLSQPR